MPNSEQIMYLSRQLHELTDYQIDSISRIIKQLRVPAQFWYDEESDLVTPDILQDFGDALRIHHVFSAEALSKDRFEYALERVLQGRGIPAQRAPRGNPGHDLDVWGTKFSLKTQADKNIKPNYIHISKFMELGKGDWTDKIEDLRGLVIRFMGHLSRYDRIFTLRRLRDTSDEHYELVEIPKSLLERAVDGALFLSTDSRQYPKPGYCTVYDNNGSVEFKLYFDGGTERKLQVKDLRKDLCIVHATWKFPRAQADKEQIFKDAPILL